MILLVVEFEFKALVVPRLRWFRLELGDLKLNSKTYFDVKKGVTGLVTTIRESGKAYVYVSKAVGWG